LRALAAGLQGNRDHLDSELRKAVDILNNSQSVLILYGKGLTQGSLENMKALLDLAALLRQQPFAASEKREVNLLSVKGDTNILAASQLGLDGYLKLNGQTAVYLALGDDYPTQRLLERVASAQTKIVQASFASAATEMADIILPVGVWSEQSGHFLNLDGRLQAAQQLIQAPSGVWNNLTVLETISKSVGAPIRSDWKDMLQERVAPIALQLN